MRILFLDSGARHSTVVFSVHFYCDVFPDGSCDVYFIDSDGGFWVCNSMSFADFEEYSFRLAVDGYLDLRSFVFHLVPAKEKF